MRAALPILQLSILGLAMLKRPDVNDTLARSMIELRTLQRYTLEAFELQQHEDDLEYHEDAAQLISHTVEVLRKHIKRLDTEIAALGGSSDALRAATTSMSGAFLGFLSKIRSHDTSKMLRDDYTLLSLASIGYIMLHTTSLALSRSDVAEIAMEHHQELVPLVREIAQTLPHLVLQDLSRSFGQVNDTAADQTLLAASRTVLPDTPWAVVA